MVSRIRIAPLLCAAAGTAAGFYFLSSIVLPAAAVVLLVSLALLCFFRALSSLYSQERLFQITSACACALSVGLFLGICASRAGSTTVRFGIPENKITAVEGVLLEDPRGISGGRALAAISLRRCAGEGSLRVNSSGEIAVFFSRESAQRLREFGRGTVVFAEGKLRSGDTGWSFSAESLHVVKRASALERMRTAVRLDLISRFDGKNWGGLALALLVGIKDNLDTNLSAMYRNAGSSYILALSGMHLAILVVLIAFLLKKPLGLKMSAVTSALIICLYCFLVGPMPSLHRAALMYIIGVVTILGGLPKKPLSVLALSFLIQIVITPSAGNSISFVLSYLALAGILLIGQPLYSLAAGKVPGFILQPLGVSAGAFLATAGVTGFTFGIIAPIGIVVSLALIPLTTAFMITSIIWLALDMLSLSGFLNLPLSLLYQLMERIVSLAGGIPGVSANPAVILALSLVMSLLIAALEYRRRAVLVRLQPFS